MIQNTSFRPSVISRKNITENQHTRLRAKIETIPLRQEIDMPPKNPPI